VHAQPHRAGQQSAGSDRVLQVATGNLG
jgi:hypothetical protein